MSFAGEFTQEELKARLERLGITLGCVGAFHLDDIQKKAEALVLVSKPWYQLRQRLLRVEACADLLRTKTAELRDHCSHSGLPKRELGEEYSDTCPDCGYVAYCFRG